MTSEQTGTPEGTSGSGSYWGLLTCSKSGDSKYLSKDYFTIGSGRENDLVLPFSHISDTHFALTQDPDGRAWLFDLSQSGVFLNGESVLNDARELHHGDIITTLKAANANSADAFTFFLPNRDQENSEVEKEREEKEDRCRKRTSVAVDDDPNRGNCGDSPCKETGAPLSSSAKRPSLSKKASVDLCDLLTCSICDEIMYDCVSIQPCLHSYCRHCLLQWRTKDNICPLCRCNILGYGKNHQLGCIIDEYLKRHPESQKSAEEKEAIRRTLDSLQTELPTANDTATASNSSNVSDDSSNESQSSTHPPSAPRAARVDLPPQNCDWCQAVLANSGSTCRSHIACACCNRRMPSPDTTIAASLPQSTCCLCARSFCALLCTPPATCLCNSSSCVGTLDDLRVELPLPNPLLLWNPVESSFVLAYLARQNIAHQDFLAILLQNLPTLTSHRFNDGLNEDSLATVDLTSKMCRACRRSCLSRLVYAWRLNLPQAAVSQNWPHRPNCYYGRNCRTQVSSLTHAQRYNHCCEQTRFT
nr:unnamed protein product [Spirometra erinaceieuropaei]